MGILYKRENAFDKKQINDLSIPSIDLLICNIYPFEKEVLDKKRSLEDVVDFIDIGGPSLIRAAAKTLQVVYLSQIVMITPNLKKYFIMDLII